MCSGQLPVTCGDGDCGGGAGGSGGGGLGGVGGSGGGGGGGGGGCKRYRNKSYIESE